TMLREDPLADTIGFLPVVLGSLLRGLVAGAAADVLDRQPTDEMGPRRGVLKEAARRRCAQAEGRPDPIDVRSVRYHCRCCGAYSPSGYQGGANAPLSVRGNAMTKILLVEDNEMSRDMLSLRLPRAGF